MSLYTLQDITIPNPNIIAIIEDPPYDKIGKGEPTIGKRPSTIPMFTTTYMKKAVAKLKQKSFPKLLLVTFPILIILEMIIPYKIKYMLIININLMCACISVDY